MFSLLMTAVLIGQPAPATAPPAPTPTYSGTVVYQNGIIVSVTPAAAPLPVTVPMAGNCASAMTSANCSSAAMSASCSSASTTRFRLLRPFANRRAMSASGCGG
jgi:hypothetical protein